MSKGIKRVLVIAVVAVALIAITTSVAFAFWDKKEDKIDLVVNNTASNVILTVAKDESFTNSVKLVPKKSFTDATHATSICIGAFTPTVTSDGNDSEAIAKTKLTYSIEAFTLGTNNDQLNTNNFVITVNTNSASATDGIVVNNNLTSSTKYYIHIAFADNISLEEAKKFDANAIALKIKVTASSMSAA